MAYVRFTIQIDCENVEPSRIIPHIHGEIFDYPEEGFGEELGQKIGRLNAYLVQRSRAVNDGASLFDAMDSIDQSVYDCYAALFEEPTVEWGEAVEKLYRGEIGQEDVLFLDSIELEPKHRGKGIGPQVVRELIATFASSGIALVACKPFPLQYSQWNADDEEHKRKREQPGFEEKQIADFARVTRVWTDLGFRKLASDSGFYTYAPQFSRQPDLPRVPRGRLRTRKTLKVTK
jgi:GNAT superfamily N-acetyltransferase